MPKARKKAGFAPTGAVCRSGTRLPVHSRVSPLGGKGGTPFPALVPGTGTLPVGFQGRSALVAEGEIPERCGEGLEFLGDEPEKFGEGA